MVGWATMRAPMKPSPISAMRTPPIRSPNRMEEPTSIRSGVICPSAVELAICMLASATT